MKRLLIAAMLAFTLSAPIAGCATDGGITAPSQQENVTKALASAESAATIAGKGVSLAVSRGWIKPGSDTAVTVAAALKGANFALDAAQQYVAAGLLDQAQEAIATANDAIDTATSKTPQEG